MRIRYIEDLSLAELQLELEKKKKLALDAGLLNRLPDKGATILQRIVALNHIIAQRLAPSEPEPTQSFGASSEAIPAASPVPSGTEASAAVLETPEQPIQPEQPEQPSSQAKSSLTDAVAGPEPTSSTTPTTPAVSSDQDVASLEANLAGLGLGDRPSFPVPSSVPAHWNDPNYHSYLKQISVGEAFMKKKERKEPTIKILPVDFEHPHFRD